MSSTESSSPETLPREQHEVTEEPYCRSDDDSDSKNDHTEAESADAARPLFGGDPMWMMRGLILSMGAQNLHMFGATQAITSLQYAQGGLPMEHSSDEDFIDLGEPGAYFKTVSWGDLEPYSLQQSLQHGCQFDLRLYGPSTKWCLYQPVEGSSWDYHTHLEDDSPYRYTQDLLINGKILFRLTQLNEDDVFGTNFHMYWGFWNDCALTRRPQDGTIFMLSTIQGDMYREALGQEDERAPMLTQPRPPNSEAARSPFFRSLVGESIPVLYDFTLRFISYPEITEIGKIEIGKGRFGAVSTAIWHPRQDREIKPSFDSQVVLKRVQDTTAITKSVKEFIKELKISTLVLTSSIRGCINFHGFTMLPYEALGIPKKGHCFCLVFERATEGQLLPHLVEVVRTSDWATVAGHLSEIFWGLVTLHKYKILHRDIHPGNILLTKETLHGSSGDLTHGEPTAKLCDFGLSGEVTKISSDASSDQRRPSRYRAPELDIPGTVHTPATDIFAAGTFVFDVLSLAAKDSAGDDMPVAVPRALWDLCHRCTLTNPGARCSAEEAAAVLEAWRTDKEHISKQNFDLIDMRKVLRQPSTADQPIGLKCSIEESLSANFPKLE